MEVSHKQNLDHRLSERASEQTRPEDQGCSHGRRRNRRRSRHVAIRRGEISRRSSQRRRATLAASPVGRAALCDRLEEHGHRTFDDRRARRDGSSPGRGAAANAGAPMGFDKGQQRRLKCRPPRRRPLTSSRRCADGRRLRRFVSDEPAGPRHRDPHDDGGGRRPDGASRGRRHHDQPRAHGAVRREDPLLAWRSRRASSNRGRPAPTISGPFRRTTPAICKRARILDGVARERFPTRPAARRISMPRRRKRRSAAIRRHGMTAPASPSGKHYSSPPTGRHRLRPPRRFRRPAQIFRAPTLSPITLRRLPTAKAVAPADPLADYSTAVAAPKAAATATGAPLLPAKPAAAPAPPCR